MFKFLAPYRAAIIWVALVALLGTAIGTGIALKREYAKNAVLSDQLKSAATALQWASEQRNRDEATLTRLNKERASTGLKYKQSQTALKRATEAAPEWAATATPTAVQEALLGALNQAGNVPTAAKTPGVSTP